MSEINPAPEYHKALSGLSGIRRPGMNAGKQIHNAKSDGPSRPGTDSAPEARAANASFDRSPYQDLVASMRGIPLTRAAVGSEPGTQYTKQPSNKSGSQRVGG